MTPAFSPEQQRVIDSWGQGMAVLAGAGSGKTTTLVAKCIRLLDLYPEARFVAVSFTERSAGDLRAKLSQALLMKGGSASLNQNWVMTIHGLCGAVIREFPREAGFDGEEAILTESEGQLLWEKAIEGLWLDELPEEVQLALENLLDRESRDSLAALLKRTQELMSFGVLESLSEKAGRFASGGALEKVARFVLERYERLKRRRGVLDFNDLERGADRALEQERVRESYRKRFQLVLVDEFQDTNPIQARIILRFAKLDRSNLCVVGDPKQSIYRFRDADVTVFEEFCSQLPVQASLTWNFRSRPGIIDFANHICDKAFRASQMNFEALIPQREMVEEKAVIRINVSHPVELGMWLKKQMEEGVPLHEMALLVRKVRGNEKWFRALTSCGVPIAIGSGGLFWEEPRVRELVAFLKWWDNPAGNMLSGATFLRAPWMGISDALLDQWILTDSSLRVPFFCSGHPVAKSLESFRSKVCRPGELLMALLVDSYRENELGAQLLGMWHRVEELSSTGLDFHQVITELSSALKESRREREVPAPRNLGQLPILTLHGSKGLEFEHVILIDFGNKPRASDMPLLFWDRVQGAYLGERTADGDRDRKNPEEISWRELEKKKSLAESKRLFYVALTRARERLILVCPESSHQVIEADPDSAFFEEDWRAWLEVSGFDIPVIELGPSLQTERSKKVEAPSPSFSRSLMEAPWKWIRARHSVTEWCLLSRCARAYEWSVIRPVQNPLVEETEKDPVSEVFTEICEEAEPVQPRMSAKELGTRVHACLETGDLSGLSALEQEVGASRFRAQPVMDWYQGYSRRIQSTEEREVRLWTELSFEIPLLGEILVGSIDRLVKTVDRESGSKRYSLLDFKITGGSDRDEALVKAYQTQMELYARALVCLDPEVSLEQISAYLIHISPRGVKEVHVPLGILKIEELRDKSLKIIDGQKGEPTACSLCKFCQFRPQCPEGIAFLGSVSQAVSSPVLLPSDSVDSVSLSLEQI